MAKVLVTGGGGFIGSHLCEELAQAGHEVRAFVRYNGRGSHGFLDGIAGTLGDRIEVVAADIRDFDSVSRAVAGCEQIFHLAALIGIPYSYESPLAYVRTNVEGTYNVLEAARRAGTKRVLVTSTSEVYGTARYTPIDEAHPLQPQSPYSASKIGADNLALSYHLSFETPVVVARPFNTFGPRQSARAIIPTLATQLLSKRPHIEVGSLDPVRDLTYVADTVSALITIANTDGFLGKTVNVGTGEAISIAEIYERLVKIVGHRAELRQDPARVRPANSEVMKLVSNNELLRSTTGWKNQFDIDAGLAKTVDWLSANLDRYRPDRYNV
ncbi:MAG TPA: SDR family NAD(P)-dependent oxidoreductase [Polyangiaceae bacterium]|jgi:dTDP-glucose 4,6-dehydratase|nr:SDR family NAD(P)-dependent oxidoreductase [Polyangiaceae bacterium]